MVNVQQAFERRRRRDSYKVSVAAGSIPVLGVFRSNKHSYAYLRGETGILFSVSNVGQNIPQEIKSKNNVNTAKWIGSQVAAKLRELNIAKIVFNKSGYKYHGRIKTMLDSIRESGIEC